MNAPEAPWPAPEKPAARPAPASAPAATPAAPAGKAKPATPTDTPPSAAPATTSAAAGVAPPVVSAAGAAAEPVAPGAVPEKALVDRVIEVLKTCFDPEIPLNIYDLSLIYGIAADPEGNVNIKMTLTSPSCPVAGTLPGEVQQKVAGLPGVRAAQVDLVWDPPWDPSRLSEAARLTLGLP
jgi:FeS assembly SUF system protein